MKRMCWILIASVIGMMLSGCTNSDKQPATVKKEEAGIVTFDYLYEISKGEMTEKKVYGYKIENFVSIGDYNVEGVDVNTDGIAPSMDEINQKVGELLLKYATDTKVDKGKVAENVIVNIDLTAYEGEKELAGQSLKDYQYQLGTGGMLRALEGRIPGLLIGESYDIPVHFEASYENKEFAGKDIRFTIKINYVIERTLPQMDEAFFARVAADNGENGKYNNIEEYKTFLLRSIVTEKSDNLRKENRGKIWQKYLESVVIKKNPREDYNRAYQQVLDGMKKKYEARKDEFSSYKEFLGQYGHDEESLKEFAESSAKYYVTEKMAVVMIAKKEKITVSKEEYDTLVTEYVKTGGYKDKGELYSALKGAKDIFVLERYYEILYNKVIDFLYDENVGKV